MILHNINNIYSLIDNDKMIASSDVDFQKDYEVKALSKENCDELFGIFDIDKLVEEEFPYDFDCPLFETLGVTEKVHKSILIGMLQGTFIKGFNKAMELNKDKKFTETDCKKLLKSATYGMFEKDFDKHIQSLKQPTEIEVEIEVIKEEYILTQNIEDFEDQSYRNWKEVPNLDENGCLILKKL
jgi:hypothetical protein